MRPELLAPAGSFDAALAAFRYGADAVYLGLPRFSARADAENLTPDRLRVLLAHARSLDPARKVYVTLNTLVQDGEMAEALDDLSALDDLGPDALIVQDLGVARLARDHFPRLALHASTQMAAHSLDGVLALRDLGFTRVVLARELTLDEVARIAREGGVEIEIFVHGALCYSVSGLCLFSSQTAGRSGNRGRCAYCCREPFTPDRPTAAPRPPAACYPFSMRDLALAPLLERVAATGARSLKIEGRMKSPLYVACVTDYYRRKIDGALGPAEEAALVQDLQTVFSRPWTRLYAEGADAPPESVIDPLAIGHRGAPIGRAEAVVRDRDGRRWLRFRASRALEKHDGLQVDLPAGGKPFGFAVDLLREAGGTRTVLGLPADAAVEVALPDGDATPVPHGASVYCSASQAVRRRYAIPSLREAALPASREADFQVRLGPEGLAVRASASFETPGDTSADVLLPAPLAPSRQPDQTAPAVRKAFERLGETAWRTGSVTLSDPAALYAPPSRLNEARRAAVDALDAAWEQRRAARRDRAAAAWGLLGPQAAPASPPPAAQPVWTLKLRAGAEPLPPECLDGLDTVVLGLGHLSLDASAASLDAWRARLPPGRLRLALPLLTRDRERPALAHAVLALARAGWRAWECADLAGARLLAEYGLTPESADWSLYALNRAAASELARFGVRSYVLSPEAAPDTVCTLAGATAPGLSLPEPERLVYQHTPLYISETAPCLSVPLDRDRPEHPLTLTDRRGRRFVTYRVDGRWVTVLETPFQSFSPGYGPGPYRLRIDLSYSPAATDCAAAIRAARGRDWPLSHQPLP